MADCENVLCFCFIIIIIIIIIITDWGINKYMLNSKCLLAVLSSNKWFVFLRTLKLSTHYTTLSRETLEFESHKPTQQENKLLNYQRRKLFAHLELLDDHT